MIAIEDDDDKYKKFLRQKKLQESIDSQFDNLILLVFFLFITIIALCYFYYRGFEDARNLIDVSCNCDKITRRNTSLIRKVLFRQKV